MKTAIRLISLATIFAPCFVVAMLADGTAIGRRCERVVHFVLAAH